MSLEIRDRPAYDDDPGTGVAIARHGFGFRLGFTWDGAERTIIYVPWHRLIRVLFSRSVPLMDDPDDLHWVLR